MAYEPRDNTGSLFANDKREKDTHPNAKGTALIDGTEYWVSAWTKTDRNGNKWQSLSFQPKEQRQERQQPARQQSNRDDPRTSYGGGMADLDDDVPFAPEWR